jgi:predicted RNA polymerase sigma factor
VHGDLLERASLYAAAAEQFDEAARRTRNEGERTLLSGRAEKARAAMSERD